MKEPGHENQDDEDLIKILSLLTSNAEVTADQEPELLVYLNKIDGGFRHIFHGAPIDKVEPRHELLINCHQSYIAAVRLAIAGQVVPMLAPLRCALEGSLYSYLLSAKPKLTNVWLNRQHDEKGWKICREKIGASQAINALRDIDADLSQRCRQQYDATISYGAHPLVLAVAPHRVAIRRSEKVGEIGLAYFYKAGGPQVFDALIACADIGITCLLLSAEALTDHEPAVEAGQMGIDLAASLYEWVNQKKESRAG